MFVSFNEARENEMKEWSVFSISVSFGQKPKRQYVKRPTTFGQFLKRPKTKKANGKKANKTKRPLEQYKP